MAQRKPTAKESITHSGLIYGVTGRDTEPCLGIMQFVSGKPTGIGTGWQVVVLCGSCGQRYTINCGDGAEAQRFMEDLRWVFGAGDD